MRAIRVIGDPQLKVGRAAFNPGSTGVNLLMRYFSGPDADVFVCGEPGEWNACEYARDSIAAGKKKGMILLGHDMSEELGMEECARWLKSFITEVPVEFMPAARHSGRPRHRNPKAGTATVFAAEAPGCSSGPTLPKDATPCR